MEEYFGSVAVSNSTILCVGGITQAEADAAKEEGVEFDGYGYYLFLAKHSEPSRPIEILAKFLTIGAAERLAKLLPGIEQIA